MCALNFELAPPREIVIVGEGAEPLLDVGFGEYRPNQVVAYTPVQEQDLPIPLLGGPSTDWGQGDGVCVLECGFSFA